MGQCWTGTNEDREECQDRWNCAKCCTCYCHHPCKCKCCCGGASLCFGEGLSDNQKCFQIVRILYAFSATFFVPIAAMQDQTFFYDYSVYKGWCLEWIAGISAFAIVIVRTCSLRTFCKH